MTGIINGTDGRKMSKSLGNCIFLDDEPDDVFGKVMSISDALMREWFPVFMDGDMGRDLMSEKKRLAHRITTAVWSERDADEALNQFEEVIQNRKLPDNIVEISDTDVIGAVRSLRKCSATEARRLLSQGAVSVNGEKVNTDGPLKLGDVIRAGKLHFGRIA
jgi:tyrosyl-tRNA synthetase